MKNWKTLLFSISIVANASFAKLQIINKIVAVVNNDVILESDINNLMRSVKLNAIQTNQELPDNAVLRSKILERLILDQIILQMSRKMGIEITDEQLDQMITYIAKKHVMTINQMRHRLACHGISYETYRNQLRKELVISEVRNNEVGRRIRILPQEVDALAKQLINQSNLDAELNLEQISVFLPENSTPNQVIKAEKQAHSIINQARNGSDFNRLAITYSANQKIPKNGQIGWKHIQEMPPIFAKSLSTAKKGDIIGPIRSEVGFHIFKVNDLRKRSQNISSIEVHARHILLRPSLIMTDNQAITKLQQIASDIKSGKTSFANAAKEFSQDLSSAKQGGDLGWVTIDEYEPVLRDALMKLNKGEMNAQVHSSFGWHLIELIDTRNIDKPNTEQEELAYQILFNRKFSEEIISWMQEQRAKAYVRVLNS